MNGDSQNSMFITQPLMFPSNDNESLLWLAENLDNGKLRLPSFQRDFVWSDEKVRGWAASILSNNAIGVVVTYQVLSDSEDFPIYLADGRQRLGATIKILNNPTLYGFPDHEQASVSIKSFKLPVQHRHYSDHDEALKAFQNLNKGTQVTAADYYKGELTNNPSGNELYHAVLDVVTRFEEPIIRQKKMNYSTESKYRRDALALFYQYVSEYTSAKMWGVTSAVIREGKDNPVERLVANHLKQNGTEQVFQQLDNFRKYADQLIAIMTETLRKTSGPGNALSPSLFRALMHIGIWRKNARVSVSAYEHFLETVFKNSPYLNATVYLPEKKDGKPRHQNLSMGDLSKMVVIAKAYDIPEMSSFSRAKRQKAITTAKGFHRSHKLPFSMFGEGETFNEPGLANMARGAKEIED